MSIFGCERNRESFLDQFIDFFSSLFSSLDHLVIGCAVTFDV